MLSPQGGEGTEVAARRPFLPHCIPTGSVAPNNMAVTKRPRCTLAQLWKYQDEGRVSLASEPVSESKKPLLFIPIHNRYFSFLGHY